MELRPTNDPLLKFIGLFEGQKSLEKKKRPPPASVEERLTRRIVDGDRPGIEKDLDRALEKMPALAVVNDVLLDGMKVVGELFASGEMQLPFVLQSAETMKAAVAYLEPFMDKVEGGSRGRIVLATVRAKQLTMTWLPSTSCIIIYSPF